MTYDSPDRRLHLLAGIVTTLVVLPRVSLAEPTDDDAAHTAQLHYERTDAAEACPDERGLRERVAARLGYDPFVPEAAMTVRVTVDRREQAPGYAGEIAIRDPSRETPGVRSFAPDDPSCDSLTEALVFAVGVAIDPSAATTDPTGAAEPPPSPALQAARDRRVRAVTAARSAQRETGRRRDEDSNADGSSDNSPPPSPTEAWTIHGVVGGGIALGAAPKPSGSLRLGVDVGRSAFRLEAGGRIDLPTRERAGGGAFQTAVVAATVAGCGEVAPLFACGVVQAGGLRFAGDDLPDSTSDTSVFAATGGRIGAEFALRPRLLVQLRGELLAALARTDVLVGEEAVWRTPPLSGTIGLALRGRF